MVTKPDHAAGAQADDREAVCEAWNGSQGEHDPSQCVCGCTDPSARRHLMLYALSECGEEEAIDFETHLLTCEVCFQDLKCLDRAGNLIREFTAPAAPCMGRVQEALRRRAPARD